MPDRQELTPSADEQRRRAAVVQRVQAALGSTGTATPFGSCVAGLHLPGADVDISLESWLEWWVEGLDAGLCGQSRAVVRGGDAQAALSGGHYATAGSLSGSACSHCSGLEGRRSLGWHKRCMATTQGAFNRGTSRCGWACTRVAQQIASRRCAAGVGMARNSTATPTMLAGRRRRKCWR